MANKNFTDLSSLFAAIEKDVQETIKASKEVKKVVQEKGSKSVHEYVYNAYTPSPNSPYERDMDNGGLSDPDNFKFIHLANGIEVFNDRRTYDGKNLSQIIISGEGYSIPDVWGYGYEKERNFIKPLVEDLRSSNDLKNALLSGLKQRGYKVV